MAAHAVVGQDFTFAYSTPEKNLTVTGTLVASVQGWWVIAYADGVMTIPQSIIHFSLASGGPRTPVRRA